MPRIIPKKPPAGGLEEKKKAVKDFRKRGLPVVLTKPDKMPVWSGWHIEDKKTDVEVLGLLDGDPTLNIAVVLNRTPYIDVECDTPEAETALQKMFGGEISPTPTYESARGKHRWFRRPDGVMDKAKHEIDGVEFGGLSVKQGKTAIVPPSVHASGKPYQWLSGLSLDDVEPAELPDHIADRLRTKPTTKAGSEGQASEMIVEGKRNDELYKKACVLRDAGMNQAMIETVLLVVNAEVCKPPLPDNEVREIAKSASNREGRRQNFVAKFLDEVELWNDGDNPYVTLTMAGHRENWLVGKRAKAFVQLISKRHYEATGRVLSSNELSDIVSLIEAKARFDGPKHQTFLRVGEHGGKLYLDLADDEWRCVEIAPDGWKVLGGEPPLRFRRANAMRPLPVPAKTDKPLSVVLGPFVNLRPEQWPLVGAYMASLFRPTGPHVILKLIGEQGSAKSTTARVIRSAIDPNKSPIRAEPKTIEDLVIAANNGWLVCLDNISSMTPQMSDALCRLSTGGGLSKRGLFTDFDEVVLEVCRPTITTSIDDVANRSDLLERSLIIDLPNIADSQRQPEKQFWQRFDAAMPEILGSLLNVVCGALRRLPEAERQPNRSLGRMADFELWGRAAEEALGLAEGEFAKAYAANRETANEIALESSPVIAALLHYLKRMPNVEVPATELLGELATEAKLYLGVNDPEKQPGWPRLGKGLSQTIRRVAPNLRKLGIIADSTVTGGGETKKRVLRFRTAGAASEPTPTEEPKPVEPVRKKCVPSAPSASRDRVKAALREIHDGLPPYSALRGTQGTQGAHKNGQIKNSEVDHA